MAKPILFEPVASPYLVGTDDSFKIKKALTEPLDNPGKAKNVEALALSVAELERLQAKLYAHDKYGVICVFQALDAAGKDGTIRAVFSGVNPAGMQVFAFKQPSADERDHDFMWRLQRALPDRGRIGVWNRSHYEEVLVVRVHPEYLQSQQLPRIPANLDELWEERFESINAAEKHWARNGYVVLKFFLNVSQKEQHRRFFGRVSEEDHNWKFQRGDMEESAHFEEYLDAYQAALRATSKPWAPWYAIPADSKSYMRRTVADIIVGTLKQLDIKYPEISDERKAVIEKMRMELAAELGK